MSNKSSLHKLVLSITASILAACGAKAYDVPLTYFGSNMPPVTFHGFASQGFLQSVKYNYMGDTTHGSFRFTEAGINASMNPLPRTRIAAQGFTYCMGNTGDYDFVLDYALAEYTFNDYVGLRGGRIRRPEGIYNDIQDIDVARTFVLLPQGMYNARWRDMYTTEDGGEVFGDIPLRKAGDLAYEFYSGIQRPQMDGGLAAQKANTVPFMALSSFDADWISGAQLWWHTPVDGLRVGAAVNYPKDVTFRMVNNIVQAQGSLLVQHYSVEYLWKAWTFQAEYMTYKGYYGITAGGHPVTTVRVEPDSWYAAASYRFNKWLEVGGYYTEYYPDIRHRSGPGYLAADGGFASDAEQRDIALAFRFDPKPWWTLKVEGHMIQGTGDLFDDTANPMRDNRWWPMLALKTTFSF